jgi:hypothetical protein
MPCFNRACRLESGAKRDEASLEALIRSVIERKTRRGAKGLSVVQRGELLAVGTVERFDPDGCNGQKGSGDRRDRESAGNRRGKRVSGDDFAPNRPRNRIGVKELEIERIREVFLCGIEGAGREL